MQPLPAVGPAVAWWQGEFRRKAVDSHRQRAVLVFVGGACSHPVPYPTVTASCAPSKPCCLPCAWLHHRQHTGICIVFDLLPAGLAVQRSVQEQRVKSVSGYHTTASCAGPANHMSALLASRPHVKFNNFGFPSAHQVLVQLTCQVAAVLQSPPGRAFWA